MDALDSQPEDGRTAITTVAQFMEQTLNVATGRILNILSLPSSGRTRGETLSQ